MTSPDLFTMQDPSFCLLLAFLAAMALGPLAWVFTCWYLDRARKQDERRWVERGR